MLCNQMHAVAERYRSAKAELQESEDKQKKTRKVRIPARATFILISFHNIKSIVVLCFISHLRDAS